MVRITRRGKPVAVLISDEEYQRLESGTSKRDFWQAIEDWRAQAGVDWPELTPDEVDGWRDRSPGRDFTTERHPRAAVPPAWTGSPNGTGAEPAPPRPSMQGHTSAGPSPAGG